MSKLSPKLNPNDYVGDWLSIIEDWSKSYGGKILYEKESKVMWDYIFSQIQVGRALGERFRQFDLSRIHRAIQMIKQKKRPKQEGLF